MLALSLSLHKELADKNVRVQSWELGGHPSAHRPDQIVMQASNVIDAALAALERDEPVALPSPSNAADWQAYEAVRLMPNLPLGWRGPAVAKRSSRNNGGGK